MAEPAPLSGIEELRRAVKLFDKCNETWNRFYTTAQLLQLAAKHRESGTEIPPHRWTPRQCREALRGLVPKFDDAGNPIYSTPHEKFVPIAKK